VINPNLQRVRIPLLSPIARFIVDPILLGLHTPFTTEEIMKKVNINPALSAADVKATESMISKVRRLFQEKLGYAHGYKCVIPTSQIDSGEAPPPNRQPRNQSIEEDTALKKTLDKLSKERIIEPARSRFSSAPQLIRKPDGTFRVVLDFRDLNKYTDKDTYPLPNLEGNLAALGKANWFTTLDLLQGFHQIEVDDDSKHKTAFTTKYGQFQFARIVTTSRVRVLLCALTTDLCNGFCLPSTVRALVSMDTPSTFSPTILRSSMCLVKTTLCLTAYRVKFH